MSDKNTIIDGIDYGPLAVLAGTWIGDKGIDLSPEPDGTEENLYMEKIVIEPIGDVDNKEQQNLAALRYHLEVHRISNNKMIHNECGYWMWDAASQFILKNLTIPRAVAIVAGGTFNRTGTILVEATLGDENFGIVEQPFMRMNASTKTYRHEVSVSNNEMTYSQSMLLDIYGREFEHKDQNTLKLLE